MHDLLTKYNNKKKNSKKRIKPKYLNIVVNSKNIIN